MKLTELEPNFVKLTSPDGRTFRRVDDIHEADGVMFLCPVCFKANRGNAGTHSVICWHPSVPQSIHPAPGRWELVGTGYGDLTLRAGSSSVSLAGAPCKAHFFVTNGEIIGA